MRLAGGLWRRRGTLIMRHVVGKIACRAAAARMIAIAFCAATVGMGSAGLRAQDALPPEVQFDVLRLELKQATEAERHRDVLILIDRMRKTGQPMPQDTAFAEGKAFQGVGALAMARRSFAAYLKDVGRAGKDYEEALRRYVQVKTALDEKARAARTAAALYADFVAARKVFTDERERVAAWKKRAVVFGGPGDDSATAMARGVAGGIVVAGALHVRKSQDEKAIDAVLPWITAFDADGKRVWHRPLGPASDAGSLRSVVEIPGRGFLFGGVQKGFQIVALTDRQGGVVGNEDGDPWIIGFAPAVNGEGAIARLLHSGDIVAVGTVEIGKDQAEGRPSARLPLIVRLSPKGKALGKAIVGQGGATRWYDVKDVLVLDGGDLVVAGETRRQDGDAAGAEGYLLRVKPDGKEVWSRRIAASRGGGSAFTGLAPTADGGVLAVGRDGARLSYSKFGADGSPVWRKHVDAPDVSGDFVRLCAAGDLAGEIARAPKPRSKGKDAAPAVSPAEIAEVRAFVCRGGTAFAAATAVMARPAGGHLILGIAGRDGEARTRLTMTVVDTDGRVLSRAVHGDGPVNVATAALPTPDGGYVVAGVTNNWGRDVLAFRTDARGALAPFTALGARPKPAAETKAKSSEKPAAPPAGGKDGAATRDSEATTRDFSNPSPAGTGERTDSAVYDLGDLLNGLFGGERSDPSTPAASPRR